MNLSRENGSLVKNPPKLSILHAFRAAERPHLLHSSVLVLPAASTFVKLSVEELQNAVLASIFRVFGRKSLDPIRGVGEKRVG